MIYAVAYRSRPVIAANQRAAEIGRILAQSRFRNAALGVTGGLIVTGGTSCSYSKASSARSRIASGRSNAIRATTTSSSSTKDYRADRSLAVWSTAWLGDEADEIVGQSADTAGAPPAWLWLLAEHAE